MDFRRPRHWLIATLVCGVTAAVLLTRARCPIYFDESVTLLEVAGRAEPSWPEQAVPASKLVQDFVLREAPLAEVVSGVARTEVHPPLYYAVLWCWRSLFGPSLFAARCLSIILSVATVILLLRLGSLMRYWWLAGLIFGLSGAAFRYGAWARNYAMARFLVTALVMLAFTRKPVTPVLMGLVGALAFATHYFALFPAVGISLIYAAYEWPRQKLRSLVPMGSFVLFSLPVLPVLLHATGLRPEQYAGFKGWLPEVAYTFRGLCLQLLSQPHQIGLWAGRIAIALTGLLILAALGWALRKSNQSAVAKLCVAAILTQFFGMLMLFAVTNKTLVTHDSAARYLGVAAPLLAVLMALWLTESTSQRLRLAASMALVLLIGVELLSREVCYETLGLAPGSVSPGSLVVVGEGFDRGVPAVIALQSPSDAQICVIRKEDSCAEEAKQGPIFFPSQPGSPTYAAEAAFLARCPACRKGSAGP